MPNPPFVTQIDLSLSEKLKFDLASQGFTLKTAPYTLYVAQKKGLSLSLYESGKLVVQGKEKDEFIRYYLEPEILKTFLYDYDKELSPFELHIGSDEAGKGDFFGPLCVAGCYVSEESRAKLIEAGIQDSKRLTDKKALELAKVIAKHCPYDLMILNPPKYNELYSKFKNLNRLLTWAHAKVLSNLAEKTGCNDCLVDQFGKHIDFHPYIPNTLTLNIKQRTRAEEDFTVACASILARAQFLKQMDRLSEECDFSLPKGAGSPVLQAGRTLIKKIGPEGVSALAKTHFKTFKEIQVS